MIQNYNRDLFDSDIRAIQDEENNRKFILSFSSETPYQRWFGDEILEHTEIACDFSRLKEIGVLLYNHDRNNVIGKINKCWIEGKRGCAEVEFDTDVESEKIFQKVKTGTLKGVSVGYVVDNWENVNENKKSLDGRFSGPCKIAKKWRPYEISIVSVPADSTVGVGRDLNNEFNFQFLECQIKINKNRRKNCDYR